MGGMMTRVVDGERKSEESKMTQKILILDDKEEGWVNPAGVRVYSDRIAKIIQKLESEDFDVTVDYFDRETDWTFVDSADFITYPESCVLVHQGALNVFNSSVYTFNRRRAEGSELSQKDYEILRVLSNADFNWYGTISDRLFGTSFMAKTPEFNYHGPLVLYTGGDIENRIDKKATGNTLFMEGFTGKNDDLARIVDYVQNESRK